MDAQQAGRTAHSGSRSAQKPTGAPLVPGSGSRASRGAEPGVSGAREVSEAGSLRHTDHHPFEKFSRFLTDPFASVGGEE